MLPTCLYAYLPAQKARGLTTQHMVNKLFHNYKFTGKMCLNRFRSLSAFCTWLFLYLQDYGYLILHVTKPQRHVNFLDRHFPPQNYFREFNISGKILVHLIVRPCGDQTVYGLLLVSLECRRSTMIIPLYQYK